MENNASSFLNRPFHQRPDFYAGIAGILSFFALPILSIRILGFGQSISAMQILLGATHPDASAAKANLDFSWMVWLFPFMLIGSILLLVGSFLAQRWPSIAGGLLLGLPTLYFIGYLMFLTYGGGAAWVVMSPGFGLFISLIAAVIGLFWPFFLRMAQRRSPTPPQDPFGGGPNPSGY